MKTFIIAYMIANEVAGVAMAVGYIKHLIKTDYFTWQKAEKWVKKHSKHNKDFWDSFDFVEKALKEAKENNKKELCIVAYTSLDDAYTYIMDEFSNVRFWTAPKFVVDNLYRPAWQEMIDYYGIKIKRIY